MSAADVWRTALAPMSDTEVGRFRSGLQLALLVWPVFGACDWFVATASASVTVAQLWTIRAAAGVPLILGVLFL